MQVSELMNTKLFTLRADHDINLAEDVMSWQRIRHIPVVSEDNHLQGLLTHRDVLKATVSTLAKMTDQEQRTLYEGIQIGDIMTKDVQSIEPSADLRDALSMMMEKKLGCLPVVENGKLVGIITEADFMRLTWDLMDKKG